MPGQPLRRAAGGRDDVDVGVAVVVGAEGDATSVRGEDGTLLVAIRGGEPFDVAAVDARGPEIARVDEGDVRRAHSGLGQETRVGDALRSEVGRARGEEEAEREGSHAA